MMLPWAHVQAVPASSISLALSKLIDFTTHLGFPLRVRTRASPWRQSLAFLAHSKAGKNL
jgi:hypothetical protein